MGGFVNKMVLFAPAQRRALKQGLNESAMTGESEFAPAQRQKPLIEKDEGIMDLDSKMTVSELLKVHPSAIDIFIKRKMLCVGCPTETFHTLEDVACINGIVLEHLLNDLREAIDAHGEKGSQK